MKALRKQKNPNYNIIIVDDYELMFSYDTLCVLKNVSTGEICLNSNWRDFSRTTTGHICNYLNLLVSDIVDRLHNNILYNTMEVE